MATNEENFYKISHIVLDIIPGNLRPLFKSLWDSKYPASTWDDTPASGKTFLATEGNQTVKRTVKQSMFHGDSGKFDGTAFFAILLHSSQRFLQGQPNVHKLIDQLRVIRNKYFAHVRSASLTNRDYQAVIVDIKCSFAQLGWPITSVCDVETKSFNEKQVKQLQDALLEEQKRNDSFKNRLKSVANRLDLVESNEASTKVKLQNLEGARSLAESNTETITLLQADMTRSIDGIRSMNIRIDEADQKIGLIQSEVESSIARVIFWIEKENWEQEEDKKVRKYRLCFVFSLLCISQFQA